MSSSCEASEFEAVDFDALEDGVREVLDEGRPSFVDMDRVHAFTNCSFDFAEHYGMSLLELYEGLRSMYVVVSLMLGERYGELASKMADVRPDR